MKIELRAPEYRWQSREVHNWICYQNGRTCFSATITPQMDIIGHTSTDICGHQKTKDYGSVWWFVGGRNGDGIITMERKPPVPPEYCLR